MTALLIQPITIETIKCAFADISGNGIIYVITSEGKLRWYKYIGENGGDKWAPGSGKDIPGISNWHSYKYVFSGGKGVIYAVGDDSNGGLICFKDLKQDGSGEFLSGVIWRGMWKTFQHVFSGGNGVIYGIGFDGSLYWVRDKAQNGTRDWVKDRETRIGSGWLNYKHVFSGGNGVIYAINDCGELQWFKDNAQDGSTNFAIDSGTVISQGWEDFRSVFSGGNGLIYGVTDNGDLRLYKNTSTSNRVTWTSWSDSVIRKGWIYEAAINVKNRGDLKLVNEVTDLTVTPLYDPLLSLDSDAENYINYSELNSAGIPGSFNNINIVYSNIEADPNKPPQYKPSIQTKDIHISGLILNWRENLEKSVLRAVFKDNSGKPRADIQNLTMYADTVIIGRELHFPQTNVMIYARRLIVQGDGKINTTPLAFAMPYPPLKPGQQKNPAERSPKYAINSGAYGDTAGNISLYVKFIEGCSQTTPWLIMKGSDGQNGEKGSIKDYDSIDRYEAVKWADVLAGVLDFDAIKANENVWHWPDKMREELQAGIIGGCRVDIYNDFAPLWSKYGMNSYRYGHGHDEDYYTFPRGPNKHHPQSGTDAYPSGVGGLGGDGGILTSTVPISEVWVQNQGGNGGLAEFVQGGQVDASKTGRESRHYSVVRYGTTWPASGTNNTKWSGYEPCKGDDCPQVQAKSGNPGSIQPLTEPYKWLHPNQIGVTLQYAKDMFLKGDRRPAKSLMLQYQTALKALPESEKTLLLSHYDNEVALIRSRAAANVDYFGNLLGWTPRLASVTQVNLFNEVVPSIAKILYLCHKVLKQDAQNQIDDQTITSFIGYLGGQIGKARKNLQSSVAKLAIVQSEINGWESEVEKITFRIKDLHNAIAVSEKINAQNQAILKGALQICSGVVKCIPFGQPYLGEATGGVLDAFSNIDLSGSKTELAAASLKGFHQAGTSLGDYLTKNKKDLGEEATSDLSQKIDTAQGRVTKVDKAIANMTKTADAVVKKKFGAEISELNNLIQLLPTIRSKDEYSFYYSADYSTVMSDIDFFKDALGKIEKDANIDKKNILTAESKKLLYKNFEELKTDQKDLINNLKTLKNDREERTKTTSSVITKVASAAKGTGEILGGIGTLITPIDVASEEFKARIKKVEENQYKVEFEALNHDLDQFSEKKQKTMAKLLDTFDAINTAGQQISSGLIQSAQLSEQRSQSIQGQLLPSTQLFIKEIMQDAKELLVEQTYYLIKSYEYAYLKKCPLADAYNMGNIADEIAKKISPSEVLDEKKYTQYFQEIINANFLKVLMEILKKNQYDGSSPELFSSTITITSETTLGAGGSKFLETLNKIAKVEVKLSENKSETLQRRQVTFKLHELQKAGNTPSGGDALSRIVNIKIINISTDNLSADINFIFSLNHSGDSIIRDSKNTNDFYFFTTKTPDTNEAVVLPVRTWSGTYESKRTPTPIVESISTGQQSDEELLNALLMQFNQKNIEIKYKQVYPGTTSDLALIIDQKDQDATHGFNITGITLLLEYECIPLSRLKKPAY